MTRHFSTDYNPTEKVSLTNVSLRSGPRLYHLVMDRVDDEVPAFHAQIRLAELPEKLGRRASVACKIHHTLGSLDRFSLGKCPFVGQDGLLPSTPTPSLIRYRWQHQAVVLQGMTPSTKASRGRQKPYVVSEGDVELDSASRYFIAVISANNPPLMASNKYIMHTFPCYT